MRRGLSHGGSCFDEASLKDRRTDLDNNLVETLNVLEAMLSNRILDLIFVFASAVYDEANGCSYT
ncbi:MAG: hypothetical protein OK457_01535 [Thaumarchaeota archaeon]|nr:hypothetical protein [Nitrososphaerota archaeon]